MGGDFFKEGRAVSEGGTSGYNYVLCPSGVFLAARRRLPILRSGRKTPRKPSQFCTGYSEKNKKGAGEGSGSAGGRQAARFGGTSYNVLKILFEGA